MKTLDEVIKAFECCDHGEPDSRCEDCPYNGIGACCLERENDALNYLKEYREKSHQLDIGIAENRRFFEQYGEEMQRIHEIEDEYHELKDWWAEEYVTNDPLTWDELKHMEGKPVWVEINGYNGYWTIVHWNSNIVFEEYYDWIASPEDPMKAPLVSLDDTNFGKTWQAYRKERE